MSSREKKSIKAALGASLQAEERAVKNRFEKAESLLSKKVPPAATVNLDENGHHVIRDSFSIPSIDYDLIELIKKRCLKNGAHATKSEIMRAGLHALMSMSDKDLLNVLDGVVKLKPGRRQQKA